MIRSKKELKFYIMADTMMNRGYFKPSLKRKLFGILYSDPIICFLRYMRKYQYYRHTKWGVLALFYKFKYNKTSRRLGFSIGPEVFGYGLVIPHYGTIVVGNSNRCGNYCVLHTSTCISDNSKEIGNALYLSTGAKITSRIILGDNISVGANSVVNKSNPDGNAMIAGAPAKIVKPEVAWYIRDNFTERVSAIEKIRSELGI